MTMSEAPNRDGPAALLVEYLRQLLLSPHNAPAPAELAALEGFEQLRDYLVELKEILLAFSKGDFGHQYRPVGAVGGFVKALQSNIRHLAWQCNAVADGDLEQRVEFMGELSDAFNRMTASLAAKQELIRQKQEQLTQMTRELQSEVKKKEMMEGALRASEEMYRQKSLRDPLTGLYNRGYFFETAAREMESLKRQKNGRCCLLMIDIDHFKLFNDTYGHICGDQAIKVVTSTIERTLRKSDIFARYGGEEFVLLLGGTPLERGTAIAERLRVAVSEQPSPAENSREPITISIGLCGVESGRLAPGSSGGKVLLEALAEADAALYVAKEQGRNRVSVVMLNR